ncbi:hypothetical protein SHIRM173S_07285 [Streptomyces hirsutus]
MSGPGARPARPVWGWRRTGRDGGDPGRRPRFAPGDGTPRQERDARRLAGREHGLVLTVEQAVPVLHALAMSTISRARPSSSTVTSDSPILPIFPSVRRSRRVPTWSASGVAGSMRCSWSSSDPLHAQPPQGLVDLVAQESRPPVELPLAPGTGAGDPDLGGDQQIIGVGVQGLGQEFLVGSAAVQMRGVDERDAQLTARRATASAPARAGPGSVDRRMAPNPSRRTPRSPPIRNSVDVIAARSLPPPKGKR